MASEATKQLIVENWFVDETNRSVSTDMPRRYGRYQGNCQDNAPAKHYDCRADAI